MRSRQTEEAGFTLTELMVVVAIIAVLAAVAVPLMTRDTTESTYKDMINALAQELQRAKFEALSSKEDRSLVFNSKTAFRLVTMTPGSTTYAELRSISLPPNTEIAGVSIGAATTGGGSPASVPASGNEVEIRFTAISDVEVKGSGLGSCGGVNCASALCPCSVTIYVQHTTAPAADKYKHRFVIYRGTAYAERYDGW